MRQLEEPTRRRSPYIFGRREHSSEAYEAARERAMQLRPPATYQRDAVVMPWICASCRDWTPEGSFAVGVCLRCGTPRPFG